ncbi:NTP transferase domain-containing protein [Chryseobacterium sp. JK1]|uniref:NTP transferase domain-containing protein n=1 Tax=Chryseobacterium sp. JK1 TaxID=874294 RepID=UPI003D69DFBC
MIAIILAAGSGRRLNIKKPKGLLNIGPYPLLHYSIHNLLKTKKVEYIYVVTGYEHLKYENYINTINNSIPIESIFNPVFNSSGSLYSLYLAIKYVLNVRHEKPTDIVILDSDILYNYDEFYDYITNTHRNAVFATNVPPERYDACYIKMDNNDILQQISKNINIISSDCGSVTWEHIGLIKTSSETLHPIKEYCENIFEKMGSVQYEYDDIFENLPFHYNVCKFRDYIWGEVDDDIQLNHMITNIYPKINLF